MKSLITILSLVLLSTLSIAQEVLNRSLYFESAKFEITPESKKVLDGVLETITDRKDYSISVTGNTDNVGDTEYNLKLSEKRVNSVKKYLMDRRIPKQVFTSAYFGEEKPLTTNETEEGKSQNRRVDIEVRF